MKKNLSYILITLTILVIFAGITAFKVEKNRDNIQLTDKEIPSETTIEEENTQKAVLPTETENDNFFEGILEVSDNPEMGNFKLISTNGHGIYLYTQKNFYHLVGQEVRVLINGAIDDFELIDIVKK